VCIRRKKANISCQVFCDEDIADVIIPLHVISGCDSNSGFYGHGKKAVFDKASDPEARQLLQRCGRSLPLEADVLSDLKTFVLKYIYGNKHNTTTGEAQALKWRSLKRKCTIRLPPADDSLTHHLMRASYLVYVQHHFDLRDHPSPLQHGWNIVDGKCSPVRYTKPALPPALALAASSTDSDSSSKESSNEKLDMDSDSSDDISESESDRA
jgi:hypothetical protein